jgi:hypothetical protein
VGKKKSSGNGDTIHGFTNTTQERPFSLMPATTGLLVDDEVRRAAPHRRQDKESLEHAERTVRWSGATRRHNPVADEVYAGNDAKWEEIEIVAGATRRNDVTLCEMDIVVTELPQFEVREMDLEALVRVVEVSGETELPVIIASEPVRQLVTHWTELKVALEKPDLKLVDMFKREEDNYVFLPSEVITTLHGLM